MISAFCVIIGLLEWVSLDTQPWRDAVTVKFKHDVSISHSENSIGDSEFGNSIHTEGEPIELERLGFKPNANLHGDGSGNDAVTAVTSHSVKNTNGNDARMKNNGNDSSSPQSSQHASTTSESFTESFHWSDYFSGPRDFSADVASALLWNGALPSAWSDATKFDGNEAKQANSIEADSNAVSHDRNELTGMQAHQDASVQSIGASPVSTSFLETASVSGSSASEATSSGNVAHSSPSRSNHQTVIGKESSVVEGGVLSSGVRESVVDGRDTKDNTHSLLEQQSTIRRKSQNFSENTKQTSKIFQLEWLLQLGVIGMKLFARVGFLLTYVYSVEVYPTFCRASGTGLCLAAGRFGAILCPMLYEFVSQNWNPNVFFWMMAGLCGLNLLLAAVLPLKETSGRKLMEVGKSETRASD